MNKQELYIEKRKKVIRRRMETFNKSHPNTTIKLPKDTSNFFGCLTNCSICSECILTCCNTFPCNYSPYDFLDINNLEYMSSILDLGFLCISASNYHNVLIIRPRGIHDSSRVVSMYKDYGRHLTNPCILQNSRGCMFSSFNRPSEGLLYIPITEEDHIEAYPEQILEEEYMPYQESLQKLHDKYYYTEVPKVKPTKKQVRLLTRKIAGYK